MFTPNGNLNASASLSSTACDPSSGWTCAACDAGHQRLRSREPHLPDSGCAFAGLALPRRNQERRSPVLPHLPPRQRPATPDAGFSFRDDNCRCSLPKCTRSLAAHPASHLRRVRPRPTIAVPAFRLRHGPFAGDTGTRQPQRRELRPRSGCQIRQHLPRAVVHGTLAPFTFMRNDEDAIIARSAGIDEARRLTAWWLTPRLSQRRLAPEQYADVMWTIETYGGEIHSLTEDRSDLS